MTDLANRYGTPSPAKRRALLVLVAGLAVAGLAWLTWVVVYQSTPQVTSELVTFDVVDDHSVTVGFEVVRDQADTVATCFLRAIAEDHSIVGETSVLVADGPKRQRAEATLRTDRRATSVELLGCTAPDQPQRK